MKKTYFQVTGRKNVVIEKARETVELLHKVRGRILVNDSVYSAFRLSQECVSVH